MIVDVNVFNFTDITAALLSAQDGDVFNFFIKNDINFSSVVLIQKNITINLINSSGNNSVTLAITNGGSFRHFSTLTNGSLTGVSMTVGVGIILDGGGTGGGILIFGSGCSLTLNGCTVTSCRASINGGGILVQGNISRSKLFMNDVLIEKCQAGTSGGGVFASACDIEMNGGEITGNRANNGGGISTSAGATSLGSTLTINSGKISGNTAVTNDGGGIGAFDTIVTIQGCEISNNAADLFGGGIFAFVQLLTSNENRLIIRESIIKGNITRSFGGGIGVSGQLGEFTIINSLITENKSISTTIAGSNQGGGLYFSGGSSLTLSDGQVTGNIAGRGGGGIFVNDASTLILTGTAEVSGNEAGLEGGGIDGFSGSSITIEGNARIFNNHANSDGDPQNASRGGGGIALFASNLTIRENAIISGNSSLSYGGGIWTFPQFTPISTVTIEGGTIEGNTANFGGAISMGAVPGFTPTLTITGGIITNNTAFTDGGGIIAMGSLVSIAGAGITNNTAGGDGGGIFTDELANVTVFASVIFSGNIAQRYTYWAITSGGDSDIYKTHIFTEHFSTFIPNQTPPPLVWSFLNAYNNYDINYVKPVKIVTVNFVEFNNPAHVIHSTIINSFIGATVIIPPFETFTDINGTLWILFPPDQPAQTIQLINPEADYVVTFTYAATPTPTPRFTITRRSSNACSCRSNSLPCCPSDWTC
ncbi:hypothetical protein ACQKII_24385 [Lysinibacillus sp. NPDC048646]|uniref:hypothetical protein n=1 Tax=Lysinibacillus sp. NPDC048646 TaxID=3390574 RepID=UPI003D06E094